MSIWSQHDGTNRGGEQIQAGQYPRAIETALGMAISNKSLKHVRPYGGDGIGRG